MMADYTVTFLNDQISFFIKPYEPNLYVIGIIIVASTGGGGKGAALLTALITLLSRIE